MGERISQPVNHFRGSRLPEPAAPAGYAALIDLYQLAVPTPARLVAIATRHHPVSNESWLLFTPRHAPEPTLAGHLEFALRWEGVDLAVLAALFQVAPQDALATFIRAKPTGAYARRLWFLFEWLTGQTLDVVDAGKVRSVPVLNSAQQLGLHAGEPSRRHRVLNNLPGTPAFCPLVRRTPVIDAFAGRDFRQLARAVVGKVHPDILARAAAFLLLSDSRASFQIEGENPPSQRALRWGQAIAEAGKGVLSLHELERLQRIVIGDARFVSLGLRREGGFIGVHDRSSGDPIPDHISARHQDLPALVQGIMDYTQRAIGGGMDPVAAAAAAAFGFVYVHPFEDGNGRLHRWLLHHVLAIAGYNPPGVIFPVSAAILHELAAYRHVLDGTSRPLLPYIEWRRTEKGNVEVTNDTAHYYRYFDATAHTEFLYQCVARSVDHDLPNEVAYLQAYDTFSTQVQSRIDMPQRTVELLHTFMRQNDGTLSKRAREREFAALTDSEARALEAIYAACFGGVH